MERALHRSLTCSSHQKPASNRVAGPPITFTSAQTCRAGCQWAERRGCPAPCSPARPPAQQKKAEKSTKNSGADGQGLQAVGCRGASAVLSQPASAPTTPRRTYRLSGRRWIYNKLELVLRQGGGGGGVAAVAQAAAGNVQFAAAHQARLAGRVRAEPLWDQRACRQLIGPVRSPPPARLPGSEPTRSIL